MEITNNILIETLNRMEDNDVRILLLCYHYSMTIREISKIMEKEQVDIGNWRDSAIQRLLYETQCQSLNKLKELIKGIELSELNFFEKRNLFGNIEIQEDEFK